MILTRDKGSRMWGGGGTGGSGGGGGLDPSALAGYASMGWVEDNYVSKAFFNQLFEYQYNHRVLTKDGETVVSDVTTSMVAAPNEVVDTTSHTETDEETGYTIITTNTITGIKAKTGLWTNQYLSALGQNAGGGGGGGATLLEPLLSINESGLAAPTDAQDGMTVVWDKTTHKWKYGATGGGGITVDSALSLTSENPVQNKVITEDIKEASAQTCQDIVDELIGSGGGGGSLNQPLSAINSADLGTPSQSGVAIMWNGTAWAYQVPGGGTAQYTQKVFLTENGGVLTQAMVNTANTIYVIQYDYTLSDNITIPAGCLLEFAGGTIGGSGKTLTGNNTAIVAAKTQIFNSNLTLAGTWNVKESYVEWFGVVPNDSTIDATPAIKKLVAAGMPVQFFDGTYYLSECLINGIKGLVLKGTGTHYKDGTIFNVFNATGQRFILKLGGEADFVPKIPERQTGETDQQYYDRKMVYYRSIWCSNFILDGIRFQTYGTTFTNADTSGTSQNYAACCFDWCVDGYVDIKHGGACPGVFIANTWEVYFENIILYGSYTGFNESALYFGRAYRELSDSNISAVTIDNLFAETIKGKVVNCHNNADISLFVNNIELEPRVLKENYSASSDYNTIKENIRSLDVHYLFNFSNYVTIGSFIYTGQAATFENNTIARGLIRATTYSAHIVVEKIVTSSYDNVVFILGAAPFARLDVGKIECETHSGNTRVYTDTGFVTDFSNIYNAPSLVGTVNIDHSMAIVDEDLIKIYNPGLLFNRDNVAEVVSLMLADNSSVQLSGNASGVFVPFVYFKGVTLNRKFKFNGSELVFNYIGNNQWAEEHIVITYYSGATIVHTDSVKLPYSATKVLSSRYRLYSKEYDYCTIRFAVAVCIESVYVMQEQSAINTNKLRVYIEPMAEATANNRWLNVASANGAVVTVKAVGNTFQDGSNVKRGTDVGTKVNNSYYTVEIDSKEKLSALQSGNGDVYSGMMIDGSFAEVKNCVELHDFNMPFSKGGDLADLSGTRITKIMQAYSNGDVYGDVSVFSEHTTLQRLSTKDGHNSGVYGNIESLGKLISLYNLQVNGCELYGSVETLAASQVANGRTTGSLMIDCWNNTGNITVGGETVARRINISFGASYQGGYKITLQ